jgi:hypothetical protein
MDGSEGETRICKIPNTIIFSSLKKCTEEYASKIIKWRYSSVFCIAAADNFSTLTYFFQSVA